MADVWLLRHGETPWTVAGRHTGRTDLELTPHGCLQAALLGRALAGHVFALDTSSLSVLGVESGRRVVRHWNEICHLEGET